MQIARDILEKSVEAFTNPLQNIRFALCPWLSGARQLKANMKLSQQVQFVSCCPAVLWVNSQLFVEKPCST